MNQPWKVISAFVAVFIAGAVFGGVFTLRSTPHGPNPPFPPLRPQVQKQPGAQPIGPAMMRQLAQKLKLTEEQRTKIRPIVGRAEEDLQRLRRQNFQETTRVMERMHVDVANWLSPEQREELDTMKNNMRDRMLRAQEKDRDNPERDRMRGQEKGDPEFTGPGPDPRKRPLGSEFPRGEEQTQARPPFRPQVEPGAEDKTKRN